MDEDEVADASNKIAAAIAHRDVAALRVWLAPGFIHRTHGGAAVDTESFLQGVEQIPGDIMFVKLEETDVAVSAGGALVTGIQHARVMVDGQVIDDRRRFVDWFVRHEGRWRIQAAVDLP